MNKRNCPRTAVHHMNWPYNNMVVVSHAPAVRRTPTATALRCSRTHGLAQNGEEEACLPYSDRPLPDRPVYTRMCTSLYIRVGRVGHAPRSVQLALYWTKS